MTRIVLLGKWSESVRLLQLHLHRSINWRLVSTAHQKPCEVIRLHHKTVLAIKGALPNKCDTCESWRWGCGIHPVAPCSFKCLNCNFTDWTGSFSGFCLSLGYGIPCGLFTPGSFYPVVFANFLVLKNLAKWRDFHYSLIFSQTVTFRGFYIYSRLLICMSVIKHTV